MGREAVPFLHLPESNFYARGGGKFRPGLGRGCVKLTLQLPGNMAKWEYTQAS